MRHHNRIKKFGRVARQRRALISSLASSLIRHEKITTTEAKAKELRPFIERLITVARQGTLAARRTTLARLGGESVAARRLMSSVASRYLSRPGGYTRITKLRARTSDRAPQARIEFV
ncbi:MAG: 50S ribosomal protein L17 [bacterium]|nr:50S ribosomal protein L17 [bacterium]MDZ4284704.1 50S ribosomal protein L17 [Patescibacteria group bacterium]